MPMEANPRHWRLVGTKSSKEIWALECSGLYEISAEAMPDCDDAIPFVCRLGKSEEVVQVGTESSTQVHASRSLVTPAVIGNNCGINQPKQ